MPRIAANLSLLFRELPLGERVAAARAAGFTAVEVQFPYELPAVQWRQELDAAGIPLVLFNLPAGDLMQGGDGIAGVPGREDEFADALAQCETYVRLLRPRCVNVLAGRQPTGVGRDHCLATLRSRLARVRDRLSPLGVTVTVEAINTHDMPRFLVADFATMRAVVDDVPGVAMQYDLYHMARMQEPLAEQIAAHGCRFGHVQFADAPGRHEPGSGALPILALLAQLDSVGYTGWCGAEYLPSTGDTRDSLGWLRQGFSAPGDRLL